MKELRLQQLIESWNASYHQTSKPMARPRYWSGAQRSAVSLDCDDSDLSDSHKKLSRLVSNQINDAAGRPGPVSHLDPLVLQAWVKFRGWLGGTLRELDRQEDVIEPSTDDSHEFFISNDDKICKNILLEQRVLPVLWHWKENARSIFFKSIIIWRHFRGRSVRTCPEAYPRNWRLF